MTTKEQIQEKARLFAESKMGENWNRKDEIMIGIFYKHFIDSLSRQYESLSTPSPNTSLLDALKELVELKDMKEISKVENEDKQLAMLKDYRKRKPLAWEAARKAIQNAEKQ